jgi:hypothetical protein
LNDENPYEVSKRPIVIKEEAWQTVLKVLAIIFMILMGGIGLLLSLCGVIVAIPSPGMGLLVLVAGAALMFGAYAINKWVNRPANVNEERGQRNATDQLGAANSAKDPDEL